MAVLKIQLDSMVKIYGLNEYVEGAPTPEGAKDIFVRLYNGSTAVSSEETVKFNNAVNSGGNVYANTKAGVMFAVDSGKTVNKIVFQKTSNVSPFPKTTIFEIGLTAGDVEVFSTNGTFTINSVRLTLKEAS